MRIKKKHFFKIHSWIGIRLSILFFIVCFSGTLATLSHEMDWLFNPSIRATPQKELASRNLIAANFKEKYPEGKMTYWTRPNEAYLCDIIYKEENGNNSYVFANPYTGEIQGESKLTVQRFFRDLHYYLFIPFQIGHFTVLIFAFLLFISFATALVFYKKWWRKLFELQTGKGSLVFFRSLHRLVGLWSVPFSILFSVTGIWYFLERTDTGNIGTISNPKNPEIKNERQVEDIKSIDFDRAIITAKKAIPNLKTSNINIPEKTNNVIYITGKSDVPLVRERANRIYVDPVTYQPIKVQKAKNIPTVMYLNDIADPLHFGYWGGLTTKIIWFVFGLGISSLILTGIWITLKRTVIKRKKKKQKIMGVWRYINWGIIGVLLAFMYIIILTRYQPPISTVVIISFGWLLFIFLTWYIFVYLLQKEVNKAIQ
ncbi:PepSY-associated TM helix domain-containing protein [Galbibacter mesophilus]|uniref:PepSY-associated TM helix domain-containing protein n=1 Tax=Galbibacter mesophilus TaxID=379069 RepID=UPI00191CE9C2|nr:PepSY-associated TM helix domain-containing protein [Galbibacter mesophilus]MCM5661400.1 PepSY domain-containing protein [Galbibacter mesophilus]